MGLAEDRLIHVSKRTVARTFGRGLAVLGRDQRIILIEKNNFSKNFLYFTETRLFDETAVKICKFTYIL